VVALAATGQVDGLGQGAPAPLTAGVRVRVEVVNSGLAASAGCWEHEVSADAETPLASN
jgi:hypothetical protein